MYRPAIKVVDCTIRDGGLVNDSKFELATVRAVYEAVCASGVDYVELGYRNSKEMFDPAEYGKWRFCDEGDLRRVVDGIDPHGTKVAVMMDAHKSTPDDILPADESVVDMIRVATYVKDVDKAIHLATAAKDRGYEVTINIMAISREGDLVLDEALHQINEETTVKAVYVVDSFGAMYCEQVQYYVQKFQGILAGKEVGVHMHNNQQLAFANTIEGIIRNANYLDGTLYGLGRAAGNCPLELLLGFLKNPKFNLVPVLKAIGETIIPLQDDMEWGYRVPFMVTGQLNQHPIEGMRWLTTPERNDYAKFYMRVTDEVDGE